MKHKRIAAKTGLSREEIRAKIEQLPDSARGKPKNWWEFKYPMKLMRNESLTAVGNIPVYRDAAKVKLAQQQLAQLSRHAKAPQPSTTPLCQDGAASSSAPPLPDPKLPSEEIIAKLQEI